MSPYQVTCYAARNLYARHDWRQMPCDRKVGIVPGTLRSPGTSWPQIVAAVRKRLPDRDKAAQVGVHAGLGHEPFKLDEYLDVSSSVRKSSKSKGQRLLRFVASIFDPRAIGHALKIRNYHNYTNASEIVKARRGAGVSISPTASFANARNIELGNDISIGANASLWAGNGTARIVIGDHVLIAPSVMITAANYRFNEPGPITQVPMEEADIIIGNDVWIGYGAVVLAGTRIGDGAIIGAGATVRGDVPERAIIANPAAKVIGYRTKADAAASLDTEAAADPKILAAIAQETGRDPATFTQPLEQSGIDSFDLVTLRTGLEVRCNTTIPDRQWSAIGSLADIARLPALRGTDPDAVRAPAPAPAAIPAPSPVIAPAASASAVATPAVPGQANRAYLLNMPQMALSGLSESWLFKELGDMHWQLITEFPKTPSAAIADEEGARLYATFTRIRIDVAPELRGFRENDPMQLTSSLGRYGASMYFGEHHLAGPDARVQATTMSTFAKYGERGKNTSLMKGAPVIPHPEEVPAALQPPEFALQYRARRAEENASLLFECDYDILSPHDINGVGLLYFAAYPTIADLCIERHEGSGFLMNHGTLSKDVLYFANTEPTERLKFRLHERELLASGDIRFLCSIARSSDGTRMAEIETVKTPSTPPLPSN